VGHCSGEDRGKRLHYVLLRPAHLLLMLIGKASTCLLAAIQAASDLLNKSKKD
jgi:hypothetical protein